MLSQVLKIVPQGLIQGGQVSLTIDETTGLIDFADTIVAGWSIFTKTIQGSQEIRINPLMLLSQNIQPGMTMDIGQVHLKIESVVLSRAAVSIKVDDGNGFKGFSGEATLDLLDKYFKLTHVKVSGEADGSAVTLELQP